METGWIKMHRKILSWEWYHDSGMVHLFIHLLLNANHEDKKWKGQVIQRGQLITGRRELSKRTGLSERSIRTFIKRLKNDQQIAIKTTNKFTIITICNYNTYQNVTNENDPTNDQLSANKRPASDHKQELKNYKEINNNIRDPEKKFSGNPPNDFIDLIINTFSEEYEKVNKTPYVTISKGKERAAAGKILKLHKEKQPDMTSDETIVSLRTYFRACVKIPDKWHHEKMSLSHLVSNFNEINNKLYQQNKPASNKEYLTGYHDHTKQ